MAEEKKSILLLIAAYNEEANIARVADEVTRLCPDADYLIINDGSTDGTERILQEKGLRHVTLPINLGIGGAVQTGYRYAREYGYDIAVQLDGDGQHDPAYLDRLVAPILSGEAEYTIGSRFMPGEHEGFQSTGMRRFGIRFLSGLILVLCGKHIYDVTSGFRAVNRYFIEIFAETYPTDYPEPEAIMDAAMRWGKIVEVPVVMRDREGGTSSINWWRAVYYMIKVTLDVIICRISYGVRREKRRT